MKLCEIVERFNEEPFEFDGTTDYTVVRNWLTSINVDPNTRLSATYKNKGIVPYLVHDCSAQLEGIEE